MTTLRDLGNCVKIDDKLIPAFNIQVDNVPGYLFTDDKGPGDWYGVYFEIMFEDGSLWVIEQDENESPDKITLIEYKDWASYENTGLTKMIEPSCTHTMNWDMFLISYELKVRQ